MKLLILQQTYHFIRTKSDTLLLIKILRTVKKKTPKIPIYNIFKKDASHVGNIKVGNKWGTKKPGYYWTLEKVHGN